MDKTRTRPSFIKPAKDGYINLQEEILDLHSKSSSQDKTSSDLELQFTEVKKEFDTVKNSVSNVNNDVVSEVAKARGIYPNLSDRLEKMDAYDLLKKFETINTTKEYIYDTKERITHVTVRGDVDYDIGYTYDIDDNIVREERYDLKGVSIGFKDFTLNSFGQVIKESGKNTDDVIMATTSIITEELDKRLALIEAIDFVQFAKDMSSYDASKLWDMLQEISSRLQHLESYLPANQGNLIEISTVLDRVQALENKLNENYVIYSFDLDSTKTTYPILDTVPLTASIYLEGLYLTINKDYTITDSDITFLIPLIDGFTITCKY